MANVKHKEIFWVYLLIYDFEGGAIFTTGAFFFIERYPHVGAFLLFWPTTANTKKLNMCF